MRGHVGRRSDRAGLVPAQATGLGRAAQRVAEPAVGPQPDDHRLVVHVLAGRQQPVQQVFVAFGVGIQQDHHRCVVGQKGVGHAHRQALAGIDDQPPAGRGLLRQVEVVAFHVQRIARRTSKAPVHHGPLFVGGQPAQQIEGIGAGGRHHHHPLVAAVVRSGHLDVSRQR